MDLIKQLELNWSNGKGGIDGINETQGIKRNWKKMMELSELMEWNQINGIDRMNKTVGMFQWNVNRRYSTDLNDWTEGMEIIWFNCMASILINENYVINGFNQTN